MWKFLECWQHRTCKEFKIVQRKVDVLSNWRNQTNFGPNWNRWITCWYSFLKYRTRLTPIVRWATILLNQCFLTHWKHCIVTSIKDLLLQVHIYHYGSNYRCCYWYSCRSASFLAHSCLLWNTHRRPILILITWFPFNLSNWWWLIILFVPLLLLLLLLYSCLFRNRLFVLAISKIIYSITRCVMVLRV